MNEVFASNCNVDGLELTSPVCRTAELVTLAQFRPCADAWPTAMARARASVKLVLCMLKGAEEGVHLKVPPDSRVVQLVSREVTQKRLGRKPDLHRMAR